MKSKSFSVSKMKSVKSVKMKVEQRSGILHKQLSCLPGRSVYTTFDPFPSKLDAREQHGMLGSAAPTGVCSYCNLCNFQKPGARSAPVLPIQPWSAVGSGLKARVRAGPRPVVRSSFCLKARVRAGPCLFCRENRLFAEKVSWLNAQIRADLPGIVVRHVLG